MRLYDVKPDENAIDIKDISKETDCIALFEFIGEAFLVASKQADLDGYALFKKDNRIIVYERVGFGEDSKIFLDREIKFEGIRPILKNLMYGVNPKTSLPLTYTKLEEIFK